MLGRVLQGVVVSKAGDKSVIVLVERRVAHPLFKKFVRCSHKYMAHDENNSCNKGDVIRIRERSPVSKRKSWEIMLDRA